MKKRFAQAGAGGDERAVTARDRPALLQHVHLGGAQHWHRVGHRVQIVQQAHVSQLELRRDASRIHPPRHVGQLGDVSHHRSGDAKAGRFERGRFRRIVLEKRRDHRREIVEIERGEDAHGERMGTGRNRIEEPEERLGAADITGQQHARLTLIFAWHRLPTAPAPNSRRGVATGAVCD